MSEDYSSKQLKALNLICFKIGDMQFAAAIENIEQIIEYIPVRTLPRVPSFIEGVIEQNGKIVTMVDLRKIFDIEAPSNELRIIIYQMNNTLIGFIVSDVLQVIHRTEADLLPPPTAKIKDIRDDCVYGLLQEEDQHVLVMRFSRLFTEKEANVITKITKSA